MEQTFVENLNENNFNKKTEIASVFVFDQRENR